MDPISILVGILMGAGGAVAGQLGKDKLQQRAAKTSLRIRSASFEIVNNHTFITCVVENKSTVDLTLTSICVLSPKGEDMGFVLVGTFNTKNPMALSQHDQRTLTNLEVELDGQAGQFDLNGHVIAVFAGERNDSIELTAAPRE